jgi:hypothetical protein
MNKNLNTIIAFAGPIGFIIMGVNLIMKEDNIAVVIGYVNISFWSALILYKLYKLATKKQ